MGFIATHMDKDMKTDAQAVYTIGHSNHALEKFLSMVKSNGITLIADIRSRPYSRFASQFNKSAIEGALRAEGIKYIYLGDKLGGRPDDKRFYDDKDNAVYSRISETPEFHEGIERVIGEAGRRRTLLMCAEENPFNCHRFHLVTKFLEEKGVDVIHIRGDGRLESGKKLVLENKGVQKGGQQLNLF
jgi:uncharacterized protein (DUF488 family)